MFTHVGLPRIDLEHSKLKAASCRVAIKAGFVAEGTKRSSALHADGWHDIHLHARVERSHRRPAHPRRLELVVGSGSPLTAIARRRHSHASASRECR